MFQTVDSRKEVRLEYTVKQFAVPVVHVDIFAAAGIEDRDVRRKARKRPPTGFRVGKIERQGFYTNGFIAQGIETFQQVISEIGE